MRRLGAMAAVGVALALVAGGDLAMAGGAVWHFDGRDYRPGDIAEASSPVAWDHGSNLGTPEDGPYLLYVAPADADGTVWPAVPDDAILVGVVEISIGPYQAEDGYWYGPSQAVARFEIPQVPPGEYQILHCNDPCTTTLGDIIGGWGLQVIAGDGGRSPEAIEAEVRTSLVLDPPDPGSIEPTLPSTPALTPPVDVTTQSAVTTTAVTQPGDLAPAGTNLVLKQAATEPPEAQKSRASEAPVFLGVAAVTIFAGSLAALIARRGKPGNTRSTVATAASTSSTSPTEVPVSVEAGG